MWRSKVLTFCLILCLGVSSMGRLFSVSASVWSNNPEYWYTVAKLVNLTNMGYTIHVPADTTLNDLVEFFNDSRFSLALPQNHKRAIDSAVQTADINGYTVQDVYIPYGPGSFYSALYHDFTYSPYQSSSIPGPYYDSIYRINTISNLGIVDSPQIFENGFRAGDPFDYLGYSIVNTATGTDSDGNSRGTLDFFTIDNSTQSGYYKEPMYRDMVFGAYYTGEYNGVEYYRRESNIFVTSPIAILVPTEEEWLSPTYYSHSFEVGNEVRYVGDLDLFFNQYSTIDSVKQYLHHWYGQTDYDNYYTPSSFASYDLYGNSLAFEGPQTSRGFSAITITIGSYGGDSITYADFISYLSGFLRGVTIYAGDSWENRVEIPLYTSNVGEDTIKVTRPQATPVIRTLANDEFLNLGPCYLYLSDLMHGDPFDLTPGCWPQECYIQPVDPTSTPYPTGEPTGTPAPVVTNPPANITPEPTPPIEIVVYPPNIPGNIEVPIWGDNDNDMPDGLFSTYVGSWYGLTPAPSENVRTVQASVNGSQYTDVAEVDSATDVATGVVEAGTAFLGPISQYIWYIVAFGVVVTLIVKFLHG